MQNICRLTHLRIIPVAFVRSHLSAEELLSFFWVSVPDVIQQLELVHFLFLGRHLVEFVIVRHDRIIDLLLPTLLHLSIISLVAPEKVPRLFLVYV